MHNEIETLRYFFKINVKFKIPMLLNSKQNVNIMLLMCFLEIYTFQYGYANTFEYVFGVIHKYIKKYGDSLKVNRKL